MLTLETPRLLIRNFKPEDAPALRQMVLEYAASPFGIYDQKWPASAEEIQGVVDWFASGDQFLAVCLKESGAFIGFIALNPSGAPGACAYDLGYVFRAGFHGKGYASEGCRALIAHAFTTWQAQRLSAGTAAANHPSCQLLARLGFTKVGEGSAHFQDAPDGTPYEFLGYQFELTREQWAAAQAASEQQG